MTAAPPDEIAALPRSLVDLAEALGLRVALALIAHFGGLEMRVPKHPGPDHPLLKALGETDGRAVCSCLGGEQIYVPRGGRAGRVKAALEMADTGLTRRQIARALGISQRHVRRMAKGCTGGRTKPDQRQTSLFPDD